MTTIPVVLALLLAAAAAPAPDAPPGPSHRVSLAADTTLGVARGDRLLLRNFTGRLDIRAWDRDEVLVEADPSDLPTVRSWREGSSVLVGIQDPKGRQLDRSVRVRVPSWMPLDLQGTRVTAAVAGLRAAVTIRTVEGAIQVTDVQGDVSARSVDGPVVIERVRGALSVTTVEESVRVRQVRGRVRIESTDGDLVLEDVAGETVDAVTVDGDVTFRGTLAANGSYRFVTHDGDVIVTVPADAGADVSVSTFDGNFQADFPVTVARFQGGRETSFRLGAGGARLVIQAFDGDIRIRQQR